MVAAAYQMLVLDLKKIVPPDELARIIHIIDRFVKYSPTSKSGLAEYYEICSVHAKAIFGRIYMNGFMRPDVEAGSCRQFDVLPRVLGLVHAIDKAHAYVAQHSELYKCIQQLQKGKNSTNPNASCFALYLQTLELNHLLIVEKWVKDVGGLHILGYVHDSVYTMAASVEQLKSKFLQVAEKVYSESGCVLALKSIAGDVLERYVSSADSDAAGKGSDGLDEICEVLGLNSQERVDLDEELDTLLKQATSAVDLAPATVSLACGTSEHSATTSNCHSTIKAKRESSDLASAKEEPPAKSRKIGEKNPLMSIDQGDALQYPVDDCLMAALTGLNKKPCNCIPWACLVLHPDLLTADAFKAIGEYQGPYTYAWLRNLVGDQMNMVVVDAEHVRDNPGEYLKHIDGFEEDNFVGHCAALKVMDGTVYMIQPSPSGRPLLRPSEVTGGRYIQLLCKDQGVPCALHDPHLACAADGAPMRKARRAALRFKFYHPHRCSICKKTGHRMETCPDRKTTRKKILKKPAQATLNRPASACHSKLGSKSISAPA